MTEGLRQARTVLAERLRGRREEIEQATLARVYGIEEPSGAEPEYLHGLRASVGAAIEYALSTLELDEERSAPVPTVLLSQARLAARNDVSLDVVLRRYFSGFALFSDFVFQEAEAESSLRGESLRRVLQAHSAQFDRMLVAIAEEYNHEHPAQSAISAQLQTERVERLLAGELLDTSKFGYEFAGWHVGLVLVSAEASEDLQALAGELDCRLLLVQVQTDTFWAWLGGRRRLDSAEVAERAGAGLPPGVRLAVGEPAPGLSGWRLTHGQAKAVLPLAHSEKRRTVRYIDVGLLASIAKDEILVQSLQQLFLAPLSEERDGGVALRETLRAYLSTGRNLTSAAATLKVNRQTVRNRLRSIEDKIGRSLDECAAEVDLALRLEGDRSTHNRMRTLAASPMWLFR